MLAWNDIVWYENLRWQFEMTAWNDSLRWQHDMAIWDDSLGWQLEMTVWDDSLRWQFDMTVWYDNLRWQIEITVWDDSLRWQFEMTISICKGGLITESFSRWLQSPKKCGKNYPDLYPSKEKMLRIVFGTFFVRLKIKWKTVLD